jgi:hypothetical protein
MVVSAVQGYDTMFLDGKVTAVGTCMRGEKHGVA